MSAAVALRKESVDRKFDEMSSQEIFWASLSARRAWIEKQVFQRIAKPFRVALRKESVDRKFFYNFARQVCLTSLSARRAWIENVPFDVIRPAIDGRSPQGERG